jgi:hypothetical protein
MLPSVSPEPNRQAVASALFAEHWNINAIRSAGPAAPETKERPQDDAEASSRSPTFVPQLSSGRARRIRDAGRRRAGVPFLRGLVAAALIATVTMRIAPALESAPTPADTAAVSTAAPAAAPSSDPTIRSAGPAAAQPPTKAVLMRAGPAPASVGDPGPAGPDANRATAVLEDAAATEDTLRVATAERDASVQATLALEEETASARRAYRQQAAERETLRADAARLEEEIASARSVIAERTAERDTLQASAPKLEREIASTRSLIAERTAQQDTLQASAARLEGEIASARSVIRGRTAERDTRQASAARLEEEIASARSVIAERTAERDALQASAARLAEEITSARTLIRERTAGRDTLQTNLATVQEGVAIAQTALRQAIDERAVAGRQLAAVEGEVAHLRSTLADRRATLTTVREEITGLEAAIAGTQAVATELASERDDAVVRLSVLQEATRAAVQRADRALDRKLEAEAIAAGLVAEARNAERAAEAARERLRLAPSGPDLPTEVASRRHESASLPAAGVVTTEEAALAPGGNSNMESVPVPRSRPEPSARRLDVDAGGRAVPQAAIPVLTAKGLGSVSPASLVENAAFSLPRGVMVALEIGGRDLLEAEKQSRAKVQNLFYTRDFGDAFVYSGVEPDHERPGFYSLSLVSGNSVAVLRLRFEASVETGAAAPVRDVIDSVVCTARFGNTSLPCRG